MFTGDAEAAAIKRVREIRPAFNPKSPFVFLDGPDAPVQRLVGLHRKKLKGVAVAFSPDELPDNRDALISVLRRMGHEVSDMGRGKLMTAAMKRMYSQDRKTAVAMGLAVPRSLSLYLLQLEDGEP